MAGIFEITNLSDFLTENVHPELYPRLFVMSPSGKLVAYSRPFLVEDIKAEAAIVATAWKNISHATGNGHASRTSSRIPPRDLTIETEAYNITARTVQADLLLVLVGYRPDGLGPAFRVRPGGGDEDEYGGRLEEDVVALTARERAERHVEALMLQRRKLEMVAETIADEAKVFSVGDE